MRDRIKVQLRRDEGVKDHAYTDSEGYLTIGVGRLIDRRKGGRLRPHEIDYLLDNDVAEKEGELRAKLPWYDDLDEARRGVLLNMAFNLGVEGLLKFVRTLESVRLGRYAQAAEQMLQSKWARQVGPRAERLSKQMRTGLWQ